eukprot:222852-Rhodomonas_salina.1
MATMVPRSELDKVSEAARDFEGGRVWGFGESRASGRGETRRIARGVWHVLATKDTELESDEKDCRARRALSTWSLSLLREEHERRERDRASKQAAHVARSGQAEQALRAAQEQVEDLRKQVKALTKREADLTKQVEALKAEMAGM